MPNVSVRNSEHRIVTPQFEVEVRTMKRVRTSLSHAFFRHHPYEARPKKVFVFKNIKHMFDILEQTFYTGDIKIKRP